MSCCQNEHPSPPSRWMFIHISFINHIETLISCAANFQYHHLLTSSYMVFLLIRAFTVIYLYIVGIHLYIYMSIALAAFSLRYISIVSCFCAMTTRHPAKRKGGHETETLLVEVFPHHKNHQQDSS